MTTCFYITTTDLVVVVRFMCNFNTAYSYDIVTDLNILKFRWTEIQANYSTPNAHLA